MKKIITAINNPKLNEQLKQLNQYKIVAPDIQYQDGIFEILEKEKGSFSSFLHHIFNTFFHVFCYFFDIFFELFGTLWV